jgi:hypothetical protein
MLTAGASQTVYLATVENPKNRYYLTDTYRFSCQYELIHGFQLRNSGRKFKLDHKTAPQSDKKRHRWKRWQRGFSTTISTWKPQSID